MLRRVTILPSLRTKPMSVLVPPISTPIEYVFAIMFIFCKDIKKAKGQRLKVKVFLKTCIHDINKISIFGALKIFIPEKRTYYYKFKL